MGYEHRTMRAVCPQCQTRYIWSWKGEKKPPSQWICNNCDYRNFLKSPPRWPSLPIQLSLGHEKNRRLRVHPVRPNSDDDWNQPYSIRSFLSQASDSLRGCIYSCSTRGTVMGEKVYHDSCYSDDDVGDDWTYRPTTWECHIAAGWTNGQVSCALWDKIANLCQTDTERNFLHQYLSYTKHLQFPMLLPQTWIGIAERRRPDFGLFAILCG